MFRTVLRSIPPLGLALLTLALGNGASLANPSGHFDPIILSRNSDSVGSRVSGQTGGAFSLPAIANRDRQGNFCLGYSSSADTPDHVMELDRDLSQLMLEVDSRGQDTTLLVQGPHGLVRCSDQGGNGQDARLEDQNWPAGVYKIWVGSKNPNSRFQYSLLVRE